MWKQYIRYVIEMIQHLFLQWATVVWRNIHLEYNHDLENSKTQGSSFIQIQAFQKPEIQFVFNKTKPLSKLEYKPPADKPNHFNC